MPRTEAKQVIKIAIRSGRTPFSDYGEFEEEFRRTLSCDLDYVRRLLAGSRPLSDKHVQHVRELLKLPTLDLYASARDAAMQLNLSARDTAALVGPTAGLDFLSRSNDYSSNVRLFHLLQGYWEFAFWSFSRLDVQAISRELLIVDSLDENNFISCRVVDANFTYSGVILPVLTHLYFMLEKDRLFDEIIVYLTNRPDRAPGVLRGINLGLSGGVDEIGSYPTAGKVAFRQLGKSPEEVRVHHPEAPTEQSELEEFLVHRLVRYLPKAEINSLTREEAAWLQLSHLDNTIDRAAIPFALRAVT